ncbi:hypothetical protein ACQ4PT_052980 [Festuca glaucescens]
MGSVPTYCSYQTSSVGALKLSRHVQFQQSSNNGVMFLNNEYPLVRNNTQLAKRRATVNGSQPNPIRSRTPILCSTGMPIIFVATEVHPWCKTGGLGDVVGGLPPALAAALEAPRVLHLNNSVYFSGPYGENVFFVANDWHTAVLPCYLKGIYKQNGIYENAKVAFCIHNIAYQGRFPRADFELLNLPESFMPSFDFVDGHVRPVVGRKINWMKAGITECDVALTVSPHYVKELTSGPDKGVELDAVLRAKPLEVGIVNGMDVYDWNPATDNYVSVKYNATTVAEARALNKEMLQAEVGLPVDSSIPVIIFIGRLEEQKGSDILIAAIPEFVEENVQIIVLGTGKKKMEEELMLLEVKYPQNARGVAKFNVPLAHMMFAGADFIIVPSRFEPCGLIQLQGMRYGVIPICSSTGGLVDTVKEGVTGFHMGSFSAEVKNNRLGLSDCSQMPRY